MKLKLLVLALLCTQLGEAQDCFYSSISSVEAAQNTVICLDVSVHNLDNIAGMQYSMNWDTAVIEFESVGALNLDGLSMNSFNLGLVQDGVFTFSWASSSFSGITVPDRTKIYEICFQAVGQSGDLSSVAFTDSLTSIELINGNFTNSVFNGIAGEVALSEMPTPAKKLHADICMVEASCDNDGASSMRLVVDGGVDPISVKWTGPNGFLSTEFDFFNIPVGTYIAEITDALDSVLIDTFQLNSLIPNIVDPIVKDELCAGQQNGSIHINISGGTPPYSYEWSNGLSFQNVSSLSAGVYEVTITDDLGCTASNNFTIGTPTPLSVDFVSSICTGGNDSGGELVFQGSGGTGAYTYFWSNGVQTSTGVLSGIGVGQYTVSVTDDNSCPYVVASQAIESAYDSLQSVLYTCGEDNVQVYLEAEAGSSFSWNETAILSCTQCPDPIVTVTEDTVLTGQVLASNGCTANLEVEINSSSDCVWPGDANNDGFSDYKDVLWIGYGFGETGLARATQSTSWNGQAATDWGITTPVSMIDRKFSDSNGDGSIDVLDFDAIESNYAEAHNFTGVVIEDIIGIAPAIFLELPDTVLDETVLEFPIIVGTDGDKATDVFGFAFQLNFEQALIDPSSVVVEIDGWMGKDGEDLYSLEHLKFDEGKIEVGIVRLDGMPVTGAGSIGVLKLKFLPITVDQVSSISFSNAFLITKEEHVMGAANMSSETIVVDNMTSSITSIDPDAIGEQVYPNPTSDLIKIKSPRTIERVELFDANGKRWYAQGWERDVLNLDWMPAGVYFLKLIDKSTVTFHKVQVLR